MARPRQRRAKNHLWDWAPDDWRGCRVRTHSIMAEDRDLRLVYFELLVALQAHHARLSADPDALAGVLGIPSSVIAEKLPLLEKLGRGSRGGIVIADGVITNQRVTDEYRARQRFSREQSKRGKASAASRAAALAGQSLNSGSTTVDHPLDERCTPVEPPISPSPLLFPPDPDSDSGGDEDITSSVGHRAPAAGQPMPRRPPSPSALEIERIEVFCRSVAVEPCAPGRLAKLRQVAGGADALIAFLGEQVREGNHLRGWDFLQVALEGRRSRRNGHAPSAEPGLAERVAEANRFEAELRARQRAKAETRQRAVREGSGDA